MSDDDSTWTAVRVLGQPAYVSQQLSSRYEINRSGTSVRMRPSDVRVSGVRPSSSSSPNNIIHTIHTSIPFGLNAHSDIVVRLSYTLRLSRGALLHAAHAESFRSSLQLPPQSEFAWNATIPSYLTVGVAQLMLWSWHGDSSDVNSGTSNDVSTGHEPNTNKTAHRRAIQIQSDRPLDLSLSNLRWQSMPYGAARHVTKRYWLSHGGNPKNWHYRHYELTIDESNLSNHDNNNNSFWGSHAVVFRLARLYMARPDLEVMHALLEQFQRPIDTLAPNDTYQGQVLLPDEDTTTTISVSFTVRRAPTLVAPLAADEQWVEFDADWRGLGPVSSAISDSTGLTAGMTAGMTAGLHYQVSQYGRVKMRKIYAHSGDTDEVLLIPNQFNGVDPSQSNNMLIYRCNTVPPKLLSVAYVLPEPNSPLVRLTPHAESLLQEHRKQDSSAYLQHWSLRHIRIDTLVMTTFRHAETMQLLSALYIDEVRPVRVILKHVTHPDPSALLYNHVDNLEYRAESWRTLRTAHTVNDMDPDMDQETQSTQSTTIDSRVTWRDYQLNRQWHMMISQIRALVRRLKFLSSS